MNIAVERERELCEVKRLSTGHLATFTCERGFKLLLCEELV
jgi:hypothetical protein